MDRHVGNSVVLLLLQIILLLIEDTLCQCSPTENVCEFWWHVDYNLTMMSGSDLVYPYNRQLYKFDDDNRANAMPLDNVIIGDGWETHRKVTVINGKMPGPSIIASHQQTIVVNVKNNLPDAGVTIHWHGLDQFGTPWMDGVSMITQCPILPHQSFKYTFKASEIGTFWYHSHVGSQRTNGLYGALIIKNASKAYLEEFTVHVTEWNHDMDADTAFLKGETRFYEGRHNLSNIRSLDDNSMPVHVESVLIDGRGELNTNSSNITSTSPLTEYNVQKGMRYRFRIIGVGVAVSFRVSIDHHPLTVVASDGYELETVEVESIVINTGERIDFDITADQTVGNYWLRAVALIEGEPNGRAIVRHHGAQVGDPKTERTPCITNVLYSTVPLPNTLASLYQEFDVFIPVN